jgi:hypothetical protein
VRARQGGHLPRPPDIKRQLESSKTASNSFFMLNFMVHTFMYPIITQGSAVCGFSHLVPERLRTQY